MPIEKTFIMIKPDGIQRSLTGSIISRFENKGLKIIALKMVNISRAKAEEHYEEHKGKPFYDPLIKFITSGPVIQFVLEGQNAISIVRKMIGATNPAEAEPGTIRGDFVLCTTYNVIHASDSLQSADREISLFFNDEEIHSYTKNLEDYYCRT